MKVFVEEEYGYRCWLWHSPHQTADELESWWRNLASVDDAFFNPSNSKWGSTWEEMDWPEFDDNIHYIHVHMDEDSYMFSPDGRKIFHKGKKEF